MVCGDARLPSCPGSMCCWIVQIRRLMLLLASMWSTVLNKGGLWLSCLLCAVCLLQLPASAHTFIMTTVHVSQHHYFAPLLCCHRPNCCAASCCCALCTSPTAALARSGSQPRAASRANPYHSAGNDHGCLSALWVCGIVMVRGDARLPSCPWFHVLLDCTNSTAYATVGQYVVDGIEQGWPVVVLRAVCCVSAVTTSCCSYIHFDYSACLSTPLFCPSAVLPPAQLLCCLLLLCAVYLPNCCTGPFRKPATRRLPCQSVPLSR